MRASWTIIMKLVTEFVWQSEPEHCFIFLLLIYFSRLWLSQRTRTSSGLAQLKQCSCSHRSTRYGEAPSSSWPTQLQFIHHACHHYQLCLYGHQQRERSCRVRIHLHSLYKLKSTCSGGSPILAGARTLRERRGGSTSPIFYQNFYHLSCWMHCIWQLFRMCMCDTQKKNNKRNNTVRLKSEMCVIVSTISVTSLTTIIMTEVLTITRTKDKPGLVLIKKYSKE